MILLIWEEQDDDNQWERKYEETTKASLPLRWASKQRDQRRGYVRNLKFANVEEHPLPDHIVDKVALIEKEWALNDELEKIKREEQLVKHRLETEERDRAMYLALKERFEGK